MSARSWADFLIWVMVQAEPTVQRPSATELPARAEEVHHAEQEGVRFDFLVAPVEVLSLCDPDKKMLAEAAVFPGLAAFYNLKR